MKGGRAGEGGFGKTLWGPGDALAATYATSSRLSRYRTPRAPTARDSMIPRNFDVDSVGRRVAVTGTPCGQ
jgi:hypothetical protein